MNLPETHHCSTSS